MCRTGLLSKAGTHGIHSLHLTAISNTNTSIKPHTNTPPPPSLSPPPAPDNTSTLTARRRRLKNNISRQVWRPSRRRRNVRRLDLHGSSVTALGRGTDSVHSRAPSLALARPRSRRSPGGRTSAAAVLLVVRISLHHQLVRLIAATLSSPIPQFPPAVPLSFRSASAAATAALHSATRGVIAAVSISRSGDPAVLRTYVFPDEVCRRLRYGKRYGVRGGARRSARLDAGGSGGG